MDVELTDAVLPAPFLRIACPRCRDAIVSLPVGARFCPRCGLPLPDYSPAWIAPAKQVTTLVGVCSHWSNWLNAFRRTMGIQESSNATPVTLMAYVNALVNLGLYYENAPGDDKNIPQAHRYLQKAARLGSEPARTRLAASVWTNKEAPHVHAGLPCDD